MTEEIVFNGIRGDSGTYGLEPMTGEELAQHIREGAGGDSRQREELERRLTRDNVKKITAITRFLAKSTFEEAQRNADWKGQWLGKLAALLAQELLEGEYTKPEQIERLEGRLGSNINIEDTVVTIVTYLAESKSEELAKLLLEDLDEEPDNTRELKEQLKRAAMGQLDDLQASLLAESQVGVLESGEDAQRAWLEAFITGLRLVPIKALNSLRGVSVGTLAPLLGELDALAGRSDPTSSWLDKLTQDLNALPRAVSWNEILETLNKGLQARIEAPADPILWADVLDTLRKWLRRLYEPLAHLGLIEGLDPKDLAQAGWGLIFPASADVQHKEAIKDALKPLLDLRREQAGDLFRIYEDSAGYRPKETASQFVSRYGARVSDPVDPRKVPYYLLVVGSPEEVPFHFQYQLDVQYAVGRIDFDNLDAYINYAANVVAAETGGAAFPRKATFFGVSYPGDRATELSADHLVKPLCEYIHQRCGDGWKIGRVLPEDAKKAKLKALLGGDEDEKPALLFAASHGMEFDQEDPEGRQEPYQGALLCGDWEGPALQPGAIPRDYYLAGEDLADDADLQGLIAFFFACYSAGTPRFDEFTKQAFKDSGETITDHPFLAALPRAMLSLPKGALAVIGHVERAWGASYLGERSEYPGGRRSEQIAVFSSAVERLLSGHPVGSAMEYFNGRYAALSTELTDAIEKAELFGLALNPYELAEMWTANNDARGYIIVGDPAVRLPAALTT
jgi:hypothetical protein